MHASTRKERDSPGIRVPADRLGDVAGLLVLGEQAEERPREFAVQGCEEEREHRFRDASVRREVVRERAEALARGERFDEAGEVLGGWVHATGGIRVPRGDRSAARAGDTQNDPKSGTYLEAVSKRRLRGFLRSRRESAALSP